MSTRSEKFKRENLSVILETRTAIMHEASKLSLLAPNTFSISVWLVVNLLAHPVGWDFKDLAATREIQTGKLPEFYVHSDKELKTYNTGLVA